ncbi:MAG: hypothetical protein Q9187_001283 [Circinaria calcarea]
MALAAFLMCPLASELKPTLIIPSVFIGIGFFRLGKRMATRRRKAWKPSYLTNKYVGRAVATVYIGANVAVLVQGARAPAGIPRYWWFIVTVLVLTGSFIYWSGLRLLQQPGIGRAVGLEVKVHYTHEMTAPRDMDDAMRMAVGDGSRRRVEYKISGPTGYVFTKVNAAYEFVLRNV